MITSILLDEPEFEHFKILDDKNLPTKELQNLSKINVFIGPNNSGKSRFLRGVFKIRNLNYKKANILIDDFDKILKDLISYNRETTSGISFEKEPNGFFRESFANVDAINSLSHTNNKEHELNYPYLMQFLKILNKNSKILAYNYIYVPILRGLRLLSKDFHQDVYSNRTESDYFSSKEGNSLQRPIKEIYTGQSLYSDVKKKSNSVKAERDKIKDFGRMLSSYFFDNKKIELTAIEGTDVLSIHVEGKEDERLIYEVGDGIQALITLLYPLYINADQENTLVFIEEPELNLHPGMQRIFLEVLKSDAFKNFQFFFTTHSNHFLDMSFEQDSDISVYRFKKNSETEYEVKNLSNPCHNLLQDLGVRNSSVFLSNCTIWVEGITDRLYLKRFLEVYEKHKEVEDNEDKNFKKYREDLHYAFVEYAGSNITHWDFSEEPINNKDKVNTSGKDPQIKAKSINQNIFLIVDRDSKENGTIPKAKVERQEELKKILPESQFYVTEGKEIENILTVENINNVLKLYGETKSISGLIEDYKDMNIGKFIDDKLGSERVRNVSYAENSTIRDKTKFCRKAVKSISSYEDLSIEAKNLCVKLYDFIERNNK